MMSKDMFLNETYAYLETVLADNTDFTARERAKILLAIIEGAESAWNLVKKARHHAASGRDA